jgi:thiol-disulfide isomerase/thioredoxin
MSDYIKYLKYKNKYCLLKKQYLESLKTQQTGGGQIKVMLFKSDTCGHCKTFKPIWDAVTKKYHNLKFIVYDYMKDESVMKEYNIEGFPTIIVEKITDGKIERGEYNDERTPDAFNNFLSGL